MGLEKMVFENRNSLISPHPFNSKAIELQTVRTVAGLEPHAAAWNDLACRAPYPLPDQSHAWVASYLEHQLEAGEEWFCLFAYSHSTLMGVLPVVVSPFKKVGLDCHKFRTPYNDQTASIDFVVKPGAEKEIIPFLLNQLHHMQPACFYFEMRRLPEGSPALTMIHNGLKRFFPLIMFDGYGSYIKVDGNFADYRARLGPKFLRNLRRQERKLFTLPGVKLTFLAGKAMTEEGLSRFMEVEASSWKVQQGSALCQGKALVSFYKALTRRLTDLGWLEWHFLEAEGKTIAANLAIRVNRSLVFLKTCYDEAYSSYSPGNFLFEKVFERAFNLKEVDELNLLTDYSWNQNWQVKKRSFYNLSLFPAKPLPILTGLVPLKIRLGLRQVPAVRQAYNFCWPYFKGRRFKKDSQEKGTEKDGPE